MKKVFIVSVCAFTLCLTSCATKPVPEDEVQTETPQSQIDETSGSRCAPANREK